MLQSFWIGMDFDKLLSSLPARNDAVKAMLESQMKNFKALDEANQHAIEAFHGLFTRQSEILHRTLAEMCNAMMTLPGQGGPDAFAQQTAMARAATERTLENLRAISETVAEASQKASQVLNDRLKENVEELRNLGKM